MNSRQWSWISDVLTLLLWVAAVILIFGCDDNEQGSQVDAGPEGLAIRWANDLGFRFAEASCASISSPGMDWATHRCDVSVWPSSGSVAVHSLACNEARCVRIVGECVR